MQCIVVNTEHYHRTFFFNHSTPLKLFYIGFRCAAQWPITKGSFWHLSGTHSHCNFTDYIPSAVLYISPWQLCNYQFLHLFHQSPRPALASTTLLSVSKSVLIMFIWFLYSTHTWSNMHTIYFNGIWWYPEKSHTFFHAIVATILGSRASK